MSRRLRVAVIGGGQNCEHDVGRATADAVAGGLDRNRYDVVSMTIALDGRWLDGVGQPLAGGLAGAVRVLDGCDVVFPAVHGPRGEDGTLAALCQLAGLPFVGSGVRAGALAMDKWATKLVAGAVGIPTARSVVVTSPAAALPPALTPSRVAPVVVKPVAAGSSHGVTRVDDPDLLAPAIEAALGLDDRALVEQFVRGREIDVAVLADADGTRRVGPLLEIVLGTGAVFDTDRKYSGRADFRIPAALPAEHRSLLEAAALRMFDALGCSGVARIDFFLTSAGPVLNEVNTMPGLTGSSQVPKIFAETGLPYSDLLDLLIAAAAVAGAQPAPTATST